MNKIKIENLETDTNIVIMKLKDFKNASDSRMAFYKCWREAEKEKEHLHSIIKEVREYANSLMIFENIKEDLLNIVDKENK